MLRLFTPHASALQTAFSDLKSQAAEQGVVFIGSPGSVDERVVGGRRFLYRQHYGPDGKKLADYVGSAEDPEAALRAAELRRQIATANALLAASRMLARSGYARVDEKTSAVLAAIASGGLFRAGAVLVGSHAVGVLLNELGVRAAGYATEDVDLARARPLALPEPRAFADVLASARLGLLPVPQLDPRQPSTSWKPPGADRMRVDLLAPSRRGGEEPGVVAVRELAAHATSLAYLGFLLEEPIATVVLGRTTVVPVLVPAPERLLWHKLVVSQLPSRRRDKRAKDLEQGTLLAAVLAELEPGALEAAFRALPVRARRRARAAASVALARLEGTVHEAAATALRDLVV